MLIERIKKDFLQAYKNKDFKLKNLLGLVKWEILMIEKTKWKVSDSEIIAIIKKLLKWINETIKFRKNNIEELLNEKNILEKYLPIQLTEDEIIKILSNKKLLNIWDTMKYFNINYKWKVDNKLLSKLFNNQK